MSINELPVAAVAVTTRMPVASESVANVTLWGPIPDSSRRSTDVTFVK